jgi:hypothetical protein
MLPSDFSNWNTVYYYFKMWKSIESKEESTLEMILDKLVKKLVLMITEKKKQVLLTISELI